MKREHIERIEYSPSVIGYICNDTDIRNPAEDWDIVHISYNSRSRYTLGSETADDERDQEIAKRIEDGTYIGMPVYAYVHSGSTIATTPFSCPWDSGRSGYVYMTREDAIKEWGTDGQLTEEQKAHAVAYLEGSVKEFNSYLTGEVYGYVVEVDGEEVDSCWGYIGDISYCGDELKSAAEYHVEQEKKEAAERQYWLEREVMTDGG